MLTRLENHEKAYLLDLFCQDSGLSLTPTCSPQADRSSHWRCSWTVSRICSVSLSSPHCCGDPRRHSQLLFGLAQCPCFLSHMPSTTWFQRGDTVILILLNSLLALYLLQPEIFCHGLQERLWPSLPSLLHLSKTDGGTDQVGSWNSPHFVSGQ